MKEILPHIITLLAVWLGWVLANRSNERQEFKQEANLRKSLSSELLHASILVDLNARAALIDALAIGNAKEEKEPYHEVDLGFVKKYLDGGVPLPTLRIALVQMLAWSRLMNECAINWNNSADFDDATEHQKLKTPVDSFSYYKYYCSATALYLYAHEVRLFFKNTFAEKDMENLPKRKGVRNKEWLAYAVWFQDYDLKNNKPPIAEELPRMWKEGIPAELQGRVSESLRVASDSSENLNETT